MSSCILKPVVVSKSGTLVVTACVPGTGELPPDVDSSDNTVQLTDGAGQYILPAKTLVYSIVALDDAPFTLQVGNTLGGTDIEGGAIAVLVGDKYIVTLIVNEFSIGGKTIYFTGNSINTSIIIYKQSA